VSEFAQAISPTCSLTFPKRKSRRYCRTGVMQLSKAHLAPEKPEWLCAFYGGHYGGRGTSIQFHPNTTYENFVGGLAPLLSPGELGLRFAPQKGALMRAAEEALKQPKQIFLLHVDEINRADLAKILGEAIFLLEPQVDEKRQLDLAYDFGPPFGSRLSIPENLHILGTMTAPTEALLSWTSLFVVVSPL
jgi:5-methylcytosine-specific restriction endonuclease McrBC GTP-binding regulatory subunit McrB